MAEEAGKFIRFLDQALPFLETAPSWLKYWIYILIVLNFLTLGGVAISYLMTKDMEKGASSLKYFSIDRPENNQELPLGDNQSWMLEGRFPIAGEKQDSAGAANITVEVLKLPARNQIAQKGNARISTVTGLWRFESANFAGEGAYEIIATAAFGGRSDYRIINVRCLQKAAAYKMAIDRDRKLRGASLVVPVTPQEVSLPQVQNDLYAMQKQFFELYPRDLSAALELVQKTLDVLDPVLPLFPDDFYLQNVRAYTFKNYAMVMRDLNRPEEFKRALDEAEGMFEAIRQQSPEDAGAWNGLGSVALLRGDAPKALGYINQALEIKPDYTEAIHDRGIALKMLKEQSPP